METQEIVWFIPCVYSRLQESDRTPSPEVVTQDGEEAEMGDDDIPIPDITDDTL